MSGQRIIEVCVDWVGLDGPALMGQLYATPSRGKEIFSFEYDEAWLASRHRGQLDPTLGLYTGPQYASAGRANFGVFLDSCPDRWGRVLMRRREAHRARAEGREARRLLESDYLLGVHDGHRMGALRFRVDGPFLDDDDVLAAPPWTSLRELAHASLQLERDDAEADPDYGKWLRMLIAPGGSLGGARPKASVLDEDGRLWIAKFPSRRDADDVGAWESVVHVLAGRAGVVTPQAEVRRFGSTQHTFLSRRFDRTEHGGRLHFASAMTLLERQDGDDFTDGVSYLELAELLIRLGADTAADLEQLWRRIAFFVCVSNTDDHLRNHGFMLTPHGWALAPAYDMNPDPHGEGLRLNISESDNAQDLDLVLEVAPFFRVKANRGKAIIEEVVGAVRGWREAAQACGVSRAEQERMKRAFRVAAR
jgi:serine/threonine-protein kinase HipA